MLLRRNSKTGENTKTAESKENFDMFNETPEFIRGIQVSTAT